ncbi:unnamed protein product [Blepharisma stoltei]|uniref:Maturase K n=1 Tax=Blepharisma stoltei TaxID=1481888 RepID=A0AAU9JPU8_9CILI|nr:unnamed protein product [Blepharisma stoltei]
MLSIQESDFSLSELIRGLIYYLCSQIKNVQNDHQQQKCMLVLSHLNDIIIDLMIRNNSITCFRKLSTSKESFWVLGILIPKF